MFDVDRFRKDASDGFAWRPGMHCPSRDMARLSSIEALQRQVPYGDTDWNAVNEIFDCTAGFGRRYLDKVVDKIASIFSGK